MRREFLEEESTCVVFMCSLSLRTKNSKRNQKLSECIWHWDLLSKGILLRLGSYPREFSLSDRLFALFLRNRWECCKSQVKPVKVGFFSCWKQCPKPRWLLQKARVCDSSSLEHRVIKKTNDRREMKLEFRSHLLFTAVRGIGSVINTCYNIGFLQILEWMLCV